MSEPMDEREKRMARNETLFREVNERVNAIAEDQGPGDHLYEYFCECSNADCTFHVHLAVREYESVRKDPTQFAVLPEHYTPEIEELLARHERFWIVKKTGDAGRYVTGLDPRSRGRGGSGSP
jgi:hypothetical protein